MKQIILVGLGGFIGAVLRFKLGGWVLHHSANWRFPASTFVVNLLGCLAAGILWGLVEKRDLFTAETRLFLFTGILGGFTTFSAFGLETVFLLRRGEIFVALLNLALSVACGLIVLWLGLKAILGDGRDG